MKVVTDVRDISRIAFSPASNSMISSSSRSFPESPVWPSPGGGSLVWIHDHRANGCWSQPTSAAHDTGFAHTAAAHLPSNRGSATGTGDEHHDRCKRGCESDGEKYQAAVNANNSAAYRKLFAADAIRIPPGSELELGPDEIAESEQKDYDVAKWSIRSRPIDALPINEHWIYGIAHVDATTVAHADATAKSFTATKTWLLQRQPSGDWLIKRQMWNLK